MSATSTAPISPSSAKVGTTLQLRIYVRNLKLKFLVVQLYSNYIQSIHQNAFWENIILVISINGHYLIFL